MAQTPFKLLGLTQEQKDFLHRYAQKNLGSKSRTKAILALINDAMDSEKGDDEKIRVAQSNQKKEEYKAKHETNIEQNYHDIYAAKKNKDFELAKQLSRKRFPIEKKRVQLSLPVYTFESLQEMAALRQSSIQYYISVLLQEHVYHAKRLLGDEIEQLKKSNYQLHKIGVNVNQIAKANNAGDMIELPINQLHKMITDHVAIVQSVLQSSTSIY